MVSEKRRDMIQIYKFDKDLKIQDKGPYYQEKLWVPFFHEMYLDGKYDRVTHNKKKNTAMVTFNVDDEILKHFPELKNRQSVRIYIVNNVVEEM